MRKLGVSGLGAAVLGIAAGAFVALVIVRPLILGPQSEPVRAATLTPIATRPVGTPVVGIIAVTLTPTQGGRCNTGTCVPITPTLNCDQGICVTADLTGTPVPRNLPTRPAATRIASFQVIDQQMWPDAIVVFDGSQPVYFGQYIRFATPTDVEVYLVAFVIYNDEEVPTPNGCYADDGKIPAGKHKDRPFWSDGVTTPFSYGEHEFEDVFQYEKVIPDATNLISWLIVRGEQAKIIYCSQQDLELP